MSKIEFETINGQLCRMVEPTPLTLDATFPCLVRFMQNDSLRELTWVARCIRQNPLYKNSLCAYEAGSNGSFSCISDIDKLEIIGYPVVDGSAEWALYQMMQGEKVCNITFAKVKAVKFGYDNYEQFNAFWYIVGETVVEGKTNYGALPVSSWISVAHPYGWQIYTEPEQESITETTPCPACHGTGFVDSIFMDEMAVRSSCSCNALSKKSSHEPKSIYKVGDWVEHKESKEQATIRHIMSYGAIEIEFAHSTESDIYQANDFHNDFRKLDPSEVIVKIGCLSGTVSGYSDTHIRLTHKGGGFSTIRITALDAPTLELVESLLKAQEDK